MSADRDRYCPKGDDEIDGRHVGGSIRQENREEDRRLRQHQTGKRRVVAVMRERNGHTLPSAVAPEDRPVSTIARRVQPGSTVPADEAASWDALHARFAMRRIDHQVAFSDEGSCTDQAESFFSRLHRAE